MVANYFCHRATYQVYGTTSFRAGVWSAPRARWPRTSEAMSIRQSPVQEAEEVAREVLVAKKMEATPAVEVLEDTPLARWNLWTPLSISLATVLSLAAAQVLSVDREALTDYSGRALVSHSETLVLSDMWRLLALLWCTNLVPKGVPSEELEQAPTRLHRLFYPQTPQGTRVSCLDLTQVILAEAKQSCQIFHGTTCMNNIK